MSFVVSTMSSENGFNSKEKLFFKQILFCNIGSPSISTLKMANTEY